MSLARQMKYQAKQQPTKGKDAAGNDTVELKTVGRQWTGPRAKGLSGTGKQLARLVWDRQRLA